MVTFYWEGGEKVNREKGGTSKDEGRGPLGMKKRVSS